MRAFDMQDSFFAPFFLILLPTRAPLSPRDKPVFLPDVCLAQRRRWSRRCRPITIPPSSSPATAAAAASTPYDSHTHTHNSHNTSRRDSLIPHCCCLLSVLVLQDERIIIIIDQCQIFPPTSPPFLFGGSGGPPVRSSSSSSAFRFRGSLV